MPYRVTIRINAKTGEFETFQVDATEVTQGTEPHNAAHERAAAALGRLVERRPDIEEVLDSTADAADAEYYRLWPEREREPEEPTPTPVRRVTGSEDGA